MTQFREQDLIGARFERVSLRGAIFTQVFLTDAHLEAVDLTGAQVRGAVFNQSRMRGVELVDVEISGELQNVLVNGVDIAPLVDAELNRRMPERARMRPDNSDGSVRRGQSWSACGRAPSRGRGRFPKRRSTAASTTSGPSPRPCGTSTSPALPGWAG